MLGWNKQIFNTKSKNLDFVVILGNVTKVRYETVLEVVKYTKVY